MFTRKLVLMFGLALAGTGTVLADAHSITYSRKVAGVGDRITFRGWDYVIVRIPFRLFTGERYYIQLPVLTEGFGPYIDFDTTHDDVFTPNGTIDTLPARIRVRDSRNYQFYGTTGVPDHSFSVRRFVHADLTIKVGTNTLVHVGVAFNRYETDVVVDAPPFNVVPYAEWGKYTDPVQDIAALNDWIDYIRIVAIP
jgi:hypothetical protein